MVGLWALRPRPLGRATAIAASVTLSSAGMAQADELRLGIAKHDLTGLENGADISLQWVLGPGPGVRDRRWGLRPYIFWSGNTEGQFNYGGGGLQVDRGLGPRGQWFAAFQAGVVAHDGRVDPPPLGQPESAAEVLRVARTERVLGCDILIHLSPSVGRMVSRRLSVSVFYEHLSNGQITCDPIRDKNEALDNAGIRIGVQF